ncbi:DMT family transporter [Aurantimicrobium photophilum]|jgi:drug/metabolite transporter (DMT)-like permease|uniref:EamA-like transporter family protein n=1 Tax=Aurantimicrobium photophilum TaxID=1987356 RepID=A0A2Z3S254_9MICO|nr:DMT family transporter [Aurantimicrobium photophilum]AWR21453.1 EamA-like transporter family protein [Aurantimicrobium photophilum]
MSESPKSLITARYAGVLWGLLGILAFSFTLPFTRIAVETINPFFMTTGRAALAALFALVVFSVVRPQRPNKNQVIRLIIVAAGVVIGFPLFTSLALQSVPSAHGTVVIALLPAVTALFVVIRTGERPSFLFWGASIAGAIAVIAFLALSNGFSGFSLPDIFLVLAVISAAIGYTEGGLLSRELGSWQTICWALIISLPVMAPLTAVNFVIAPLSHDPIAWLCFLYTALFSMFLGFFAWYRGLAIGPMTSVSQVQLSQPVFTLIWSTLILGEVLTPEILIGGAVIIALAFIAVRARVKTISPPSVRK